MYHPPFVLLTQAKAMAQGAVARTNLIKAQIDQDVMKSQVRGEMGVVYICI